MFNLKLPQGLKILVWCSLKMFPFKYRPFSSVKNFEVSYLGEFLVSILSHYLNQHNGMCNVHNIMLLLGISSFVPLWLRLFTFSSFLIMILSDLPFSHVVQFWKMWFKIRWLKWRILSKWWCFAHGLTL